MNGWNLFRTYGNTTALTEHYDGMDRYIRYLEDNSEGFIIQDGLGDWYDIGENGPGWPVRISTFFVRRRLNFYAGRARDIK